MAVKRVAKSKHNNQKRQNYSKPSKVVNKSKKGKPNPIKKKPFKKHSKQNEKKIAQPPPSTTEGEDSDIGENMLDMVEEEDIEFLKNAITNNSYSFLNKVKFSEGGPKAKRRKTKSDDDDTLEQQYEDQEEEEVKLKPLLPIKTNQGIIPQSTIHEDKESDEESEEENDQFEDDSAEEFTFDDKRDYTKPISTVELLANRNQVLRAKKIEIGSLSAGLLENPEEKVANFRILLNYMNENIPEIYFTVKKLATVSLLEVFKDLIPSYQIKPHVNDGVKLKKDTLKLQKYEENLLIYYKKYLQRLERFSKILIKKRGDTRIRSAEEIKLGELGVKCLSDLLVTHPYFNYAQNIAQAIVPFLNHPNKDVRDVVKAACDTIFKEDKKQEITLKIVRILNQHMKKRSHNVRVEMLEILLSLKIKEINLDHDKELEIKEKKLQSHKQNILQLSKKEKKRKKRLQQLEKELLETKAEENKQTKQQNLTEIIKVVFGIYFRILKSSTNTKVLGVCLKGLARYAHCINVEYYIDLLNVLDHLLKQDWLGYQEKLHCIQTVFAIISGQGEAINLDPTRFYTALYKDILTINASRNHDMVPTLLEILNLALIKRRKKITSKRIIGFVKRISTACLQVLHGSSVSYLGLIKLILQMNRAADVLLDLDTSTGDGKFLPELDDPEYCNASTSALFEMTLLSRHYHPIVAKYARHIANGVPSTGPGSLPPEFGKCNPEQLYNNFDMSQMAFNPPIPVPKSVQPKSKTSINFVDVNFEEECNNMLKNSVHKSFYIECSKIKV